MKTDIFSFLKELTNRNIYFELALHRDDYIMVKISVPGERWEIEFSKQGMIEVEIFRSDGKSLDGSSLDDLFQRFSD